MPLRTSVAVLAASVLSLAVTAGHASATELGVISKRPIRDNPSWIDQVLDPRGPFVYPERVIVTGGGSVSNPSALTRRGGVATIRSTGPGTPALLLDLGVNTGGTVQATVVSGDGTTVRLAYSEARRFMTPIGDTGQDSLGSNDAPWARFDTFPATGGRSFSSPAIRGGQRWVLLQLDGPGTVRIKDVRVKVGHLRASPKEYRGHFLSSDKTLNRAWYASAYTFNVATTGDSLIVQDGAKRDRMAFSGDLGMSQLVGLNTVAQGRRVIRNSLRLFSCQGTPAGPIATYTNTDIACPRVPPTEPAVVSSPLSSGEYVAWYVRAAAEYYLYTGDAAYAKGLLPLLRDQVSHLRGQEVDGLYGAGVDYTWRAMLIQGVAPYGNVVYYSALKGLAMLEREIGAGEEVAAELEAHAEGVRTALLARFLDPANGALLADPEKAPGLHLQDSNVMAPYMGILRGPQGHEALEYVAEQMDSEFGTTTFDSADAPGYGPRFVSPFMNSWEVLSRLKLGETTRALSLIRRLWGHMASTDPKSTVWEKMALDGEVQPNQPNPDGLPTTRNEGEGYVSLAHPWGGGPVPALSNYVLGARPVSAGYRRWIVAPQMGNIRWAQGQVPTPRGPLVSRFARGRRFVKLTVGGPSGSKGLVVIPSGGKRRAIWSDGELVWKGGKARGGSRSRWAGGTVRVPQRPGFRTYVWSR